MQNPSDNIYLLGNFAPVHDEMDAFNLKVIGEIPKDLNGVYMRNGPNPAFIPISYTYPFDGDGMIHAIYIGEGKAHYRNRFVKTKGYLKEQKAGKALYGGVLHPMPLEHEWADPGEEILAFKNGAFIHIIRHAGEYLAMSESAPAYAMTQQLQTIGEWKLSNVTTPLPLCAHTRIDPENGDLWFINYAEAPPYLSTLSLNNKGQLINKWDIDKPYPTMIHDFVLTKNFVIVFDCPILFDFEQMAKGGSLLSWKPELGTRIGVISKKTGVTQWFTTDAFFVFHFANAYENQHELIIDFVQHQKFTIYTGKQEDKNPRPPFFYRTIINMKTGTVTSNALDDRLVEFPRIREDVDTLEHHYIYTPTRTANSHDKNNFNALIKYNVKDQSSQIHEFGQYAEIGEAVFAPLQTKVAKDHHDEDAGYLMLFVYDSQIQKSEFVILDAKNITAKPLARIELPRRVPNGLHGSWMQGEWDL